MVAMAPCLEVGGSWIGRIRGCDAEDITHSPAYLVLQMLLDSMKETKSLRGPTQRRDPRA